jgi:hypothetical protein
LYRGDEIGIVLVQNGLAGFAVEKVEKEYQDDKDNPPEDQILDKGTQRIFLQ